MSTRERAKANALGLRANGLTIVRIAERLGVPRATVGGWLRGCGEWYEVRECELCGERFIAASGRQRFCTRKHAAKHRRVFGLPTARERIRERARELEAELAVLRGQFDARAIDAYRERAREPGRDRRTRDHREAGREREDEERQRDRSCALVPGPQVRRRGERD